MLSNDFQQSKNRTLVQEQALNTGEPVCTDLGKE
jgi:hypothetical protein